MIAVLVPLLGMVAEEVVVASVVGGVSGALAGAVAASSSQD